MDTVTAVTSTVKTEVRHDPQGDSMDATTSQESAHDGTECIPAQTEDLFNYLRTSQNRSNGRLPDMPVSANLAEALIV